MARKKQAEKRLEATVVGRVQGVGFRYFTQREAVKLGLKGWVRNLANGNVQVSAQGDVESLNQLLAKLQEGPALSWVQNVAVHWRDADPSLKAFEVRHTGW